MIQTIADTVIDHAGELTELDRAIGDADHGVNLERGFKAVLARIDTISARPLNDALSEVGKTLILSVGGASGPLYGKLFATVGQHLGSPDAITRERVATACEQAIAVLKALGKSDVGHKTMLDVLVPSLDELRAGDGASSYVPPERRVAPLPPEGDEHLRAAVRCSLHAVRECAHAAAVRTVPMIARRGRASFLGERSQGHMDPGARSSELIVTAVCDFLEARL